MMRLAAAILLTVAGTCMAQDATTTVVIGGRFYLCQSTVVSISAPDGLLCRPATEADVICIPDPYSGDGKGCHAVDLRQGFRP